MFGRARKVGYGDSDPSEIKMSTISPRALTQALGSVTAQVQRAGASRKRERRPLRGGAR
jgi:hypothetical protein